MRTFGKVVTIVGATLFLSSTALARTVCLQDFGGTYYIFNNVKSLKPGKAIPLTGTYDTIASRCPVSGTAVLTTSGQLRVGILVHCIDPIDGQNFSAALVGTPDFNATGKLDSDGDYQEDALPAYSWAPVDCATVPVP